YERDSRLAWRAARGSCKGRRAQAHGDAGSARAPLRSVQKCGRGCAAARSSGAGALSGTAAAAPHARGPAKLAGPPGNLCVLISGPCSRIKQGTISWGASDGTANHIAARLVIALEGDQAALGGLLEQLVERAEAVVALVESRAAALQRLLDHRTPDLVLCTPLGEQGVDGGEYEVERFLLLVLILLLAVLGLGHGGRRSAVRGGRSGIGGGRLAARAAAALGLFAHEVVVVDEL